MAEYIEGGFFHELPKALDAEENFKLLTQYKQTGNAKFKDQLILGNLRFAFYYIWGFMPSVKRLYNFKNGEKDDLLQDLSLSISKAIEKFDISKETTFSFYCSSVIRSDMKTKLTNYYKKHRLSTKADLKSNERFVVVSLSDQFMTDPDGKNLTYELASKTKNFFCENEIVENADMHFIIEKILPVLNPDQKMLLEEYYLKRQSQRSLAAKYGIPLSSVSRQLSLACENIKYMYEHGIQNYTDSAQPHLYKPRLPKASKQTPSQSEEVPAKNQNRTLTD